MAALSLLSMARRFSEDTVRRASRVVNHVALRERRSLFECLTRKNAEAIARLMKQKPIFWENKKNIPDEIYLDQEVADLFPKEFFRNPTRWLERQPNIVRPNEEILLPDGETIEKLWDCPYDITKVKEFGLPRENGGELRIVSKRLRPDEAKEVIVAMAAYRAGIPTPMVLGEILDRGNLYAFFEHIDGMNVNGIKHRFEYYHLHSVMKEFFVTDTTRGAGQILYTRPPFKHLSGFARDEIMRIWEERSKGVVRTLSHVRRRFETFFFLLSKYNHGDELEKANQAGTIEKYLLDLKNLPSTEIRIVLSQTGYSSLRVLENEIEPLWRGEDIDPQNKGRYEAISSRLIQDQRIEETQLEETITRIVEQDIFGVDFEAKKGELQEMCRALGIEHQDFNDRNLMIAWDFEQNEPRKKKSGDTDVYIIDWESHE